MVDFAAVGRGETTLAELARNLTVQDLHDLTDEMIDLMLNITASTTDVDVVFVPTDSNANDEFGKAEDQGLAWTLGHVVVHATASSEEAAALASALARGVVPEGRSRSEVPWETMQTALHIRERLEESRRMRHAFLHTWPAAPHLDVTYTPIPRFGPLNATARFMLGLFHDDAHLDQLSEIMRQAEAARKPEAQEHKR